MPPIGINLEIITNYCLSNACMLLPQSVFFSISSPFDAVWGCFVIRCHVSIGGATLRKPYAVHTVLVAEPIKKPTFHKHFCTSHLLESPQIQPDFQIVITYAQVIRLHISFCKALKQSA